MFLCRSYKVRLQEREPREPAGLVGSHRDADLDPKVEGKALEWDAGRWARVPVQCEGRHFGVISADKGGFNRMLDAMENVRVLTVTVKPIARTYDRGVIAVRVTGFQTCG